MLNKRFTRAAALLCLLAATALPLPAAATLLGDAALPDAVSAWAQAHPAPDYATLFMANVMPDMRPPQGAPSALTLDPARITGPFLVYSTDSHTLAPAPDDMVSGLPAQYFGPDHWTALAAQDAPLVFLVCHAAEDITIGRNPDGTYITVSNHHIYAIDETGAFLGHTTVQADDYTEPQLVPTGVRYVNNNPFRTYLNILYSR